jgi:hypothetical protein
MEYLFGTKYGKTQFIELLNNGECPICHKANFKKVMIHMNAIHGIPKNDICDELMISRETGFADETTRENSRALALNQGLGVKIVPETTTKGIKWSNLTRAKMTPDRKKRGKCIVMFRKKFIENNPTKSHEQSVYAGKRASKAHWGTEEGYNDLFYARIAQAYVDEFNKSKSCRNILISLGKKVGIDKYKANYYINTVCKNRKLLEINGSFSGRTVSLTEKAKELLNSGS